MAKQLHRMRFWQRQKDKPLTTDQWFSAPQTPAGPKSASHRR